MFSGRPWWKRLQRPGDASLKSRRRFLAAVVSLVAVIVFFLSFGAPLRLVDARAFDFLSTIVLPPVTEESPVIVAIDEPSFAEFGLQWPWPRDLHARLIEALRAAGARAIGIDIIFAEPSSPAADRALADAMGPDIVLAADETLIPGPQADQMAAEAQAAGGEAAPVLKVGIGINTGACVVGNMGSETLFDYSALGDAVNLASRLESETRTVGVPLLLGPETAAAVAGRFTLAELGPVGVKGKALPVTVWTLAAYAPVKRLAG